MKTQLLTLAAIIIFALGASANSSRPDYAIIDADILNTETLAETSLAIEDWMLDDAAWKITNNLVDFDSSDETSLQIESWMTDNKLWNQEKIENCNGSELVQAETKADLTIEDWMTDDQCWLL